MLNKSGVKKTSYANPNQILANVELQASVGCVVPQSIGVTEGAKTIAKAGTPLKINFDNLVEDAALATGSVVMNAVLLHDVDVTDGKANGTALIFGFVNLNRIDTVTQGKITTAKGATGVTQLVTFLKQ